MTESRKIYNDEAIKRLIAAINGPAYTTCMFGIPLFTYNGYLEVIDEGIQYKVHEWQLVDAA